MFDSPDFDVAPYGAIDMTKYVRRSYCSWDDAQWRSLLVQCFVHVRQVEEGSPGTRRTAAAERAARGWFEPAWTAR